jgi:hypothetical protein
MLRDLIREDLYQSTVAHLRGGRIAPRSLRKMNTSTRRQVSPGTYTVLLLDDRNS